MSELIFAAAFVGTFLSVTLNSSLAWKEHHPDHPRSFSQLVAQTKELVKWFRIVSAVVASLFAVTMYFFVVPNILYGTAMFVVWSVYYASELLLAIFPERGTIEKQLHSLFAYSMAFAMLATTFIFILSFKGRVRALEIAILIGMMLLGVLTRVDNKRFLFYELPFIYLSHASILIAALTLK
jgi:hypothetical protein